MLSGSFVVGKASSSLSLFRVTLVESIPEGLYSSSPPSRQSIAHSWLHLLDKANSSVHIAAFYFTLRGDDLESADSSDSQVGLKACPALTFMLNPFLSFKHLMCVLQGRKVFKSLKHLESRGVNLQVAVNGPQTSIKDTAELAATGTEIQNICNNWGSRASPCSQSHCQESIMTCQWGEHQLLLCVQNGIYSNSNIHIFRCRS